MKHSTRHFLSIAAAATIAALALNACGGSGGMTGDRTGPPVGPTMPPNQAGTIRDTTLELAGLTAADAAHAPVTVRAGNVRVGPDIRPAAPPGGASAMRNGITVRSGQVRDGSTREDITNYLDMVATPGAAISLQRPAIPHTVSLTASANETIRPFVIRAIQLVNAALPLSDRMVMTTTRAPEYHDVDAREDNHLYIDVRPLLPGTGGRAESSSVDGVITSAYLTIANETLELIRGAIDAQDRLNREDHLMAHLVHEIIHTLGALEHPDPEVYPDSVMSYSFLWKPGDVLYRIDRDVLAASHLVLGRGLDRPATYEALGAWSETSNHLSASLAHSPQDGAHTAYGVRTRHGFAEAWAEGPIPATTLDANRALDGNVTWEGGLLGYTPDERSVAGDTALEMNLATMNGELRFTNLEYWAPDTPGSPFTHTALHYDIAARGNRFVSTGGADGTATGVFTGTGHEGMGGTVERTDLTAAFAGTR